jgi:hypothetical protein
VARKEMIRKISANVTVKTLCLFWGIKEPGVPDIIAHPEVSERNPAAMAQRGEGDYCVFWDDVQIELADPELERGVIWSNNGSLSLLPSAEQQWLSQESPRYFFPGAKIYQPEEHEALNLEGLEATCYHYEYCQGCPMVRGRNGLWVALRETDEFLP